LAGAIGLVLVLADRLDQRWLIVAHVPTAWLLLGAMANAVVEEITWRGYFVESLVAEGLRFHGANFLQGLAFGATHWNGFPGGTIGIGLATGFGLAMGLVARRSRGLVIPVSIHFFADIIVIRLLTT
jgi:membrane protease YdiL (CAAX protease family)